MKILCPNCKSENLTLLDTLESERLMYNADTIYITQCRDCLRRVIVTTRLASGL